MTDLLDANVWLARVDENHVHHATAVAYWQNQAQDTMAFCRISLLGFLRLATRKGVLGGGGVGQGASSRQPGPWMFSMRLRSPAAR